MRWWAGAVTAEKQGGQLRRHRMGLSLQKCSGGLPTLQRCMLMQWLAHPRSLVIFSPACCLQAGQSVGGGRSACRCRIFPTKFHSRL